MQTCVNLPFDRRALRLKEAQVFLLTKKPRDAKPQHLAAKRGTSQECRAAHVMPK
jgi:hypothetical protein